MDTRQEIHSRMLRDVARLWGYQESEMDLAAFDPAVSLLLGACATEFDKLRQEMSTSRERILDRLAATLTPEVLVVPTPAHAVVHARALETEAVFLPTHQVYCKKKIGKTEKEVFFSPAAPYRLVNGAVRYLATAGRIVRADNLPFRDTVAQSDPSRQPAGSSTLWIGLAGPGPLASFHDLAFFFNWKNEPRLRQLLQQLPFCRWYAGPHELVAEKGRREKASPDFREIRSPFEREFSALWQVKRRVDQYYEPHFITLSGPVGRTEIAAESLKKNYPEELEKFFRLDDLTALDEKLLWLRVDFPEYFPADALANMECLLNCVPVLNKSFHREIFRLQDQINILPLRCDDFFFNVHRVSNEQEQEFHSNPLANLRDLEGGTYTMRSRGAGKLDDRAASRHLYHLIDLLRDESAAFAAFNLDYLDGKVRRLNQEITDLEQHVREGDSQREELPYLVIKPPKGSRNQQVGVEFWSTHGETANGIAAGAKLELYGARGFERDSIQLVMPSTGGSNRKSPSESFYALKKALTTRDRVISKEDIRTFCFARLGNRLAQATIRKGFYTSPAPEEGMVRTLDVLVHPASPLTAATAPEWEGLCQELETELNSQSAGLLPIRVLSA